MNFEARRPKRSSSSVNSSPESLSTFSPFSSSFTPTATPRSVPYKFISHNFTLHDNPECDPAIRRHTVGHPSWIGTQFRSTEGNAGECTCRSVECRQRETVPTPRIAWSPASVSEALPICCVGNRETNNGPARYCRGTPPHRRRPNMRSHSRVRRPYPGCTRLYRRSCTAHGRQQLRSCRRTCPTCPGRKNTAELSGPRPSHQINSTSSPSISNQGQLACKPALRRIFHSTTNN